MAGFPSKVLAAVAPLLVVAGLGAPPAGAAGYPRINGQHHLGRGCTVDDAQVAGGTIVMAAGEEAAAGGGTGAGCDTFVAYELHPGAPAAAGPALEPGLYLSPGGLARHRDRRP